MIEVTPYTFVLVILSLLASHFIASLLGFVLCYLGSRVYNTSARRVMNNLGEEIQLRSQLPPTPAPQFTGEMQAPMPSFVLDDEFEADLEDERAILGDPARLAQRMAQQENRE